MKITKGDGSAFGYQPLDEGKNDEWMISQDHADVASYLEKLALQNQVFHDDIVLHDVLADPTYSPNTTQVPQRKPRYTPEQMYAQIANSAGNLGHQSGVVPKIPPVFWTALGRTIASSVLKRCN